jgi:hypothetical protein
MKNLNDILSISANKKVLDTVYFHGHENILATHKNSIEITREEQITRKGDCIIGVKASKGVGDFEYPLKKWIQAGGGLEFEIKTGIYSFTFEGQGSPALDLLDKKEIVLRKSDYTSSRTAAINCSHSAFEIPRDLIKVLQDRDAIGNMTISSVVSKKNSEFVWSLP